MLHSSKITFFLLEILIIPAIMTVNTQPYCYQNITETSYKMVTKTRLQNVSSKNFFKKIILKKDTKMEIYEEQEPVHTTKLIRLCCEGYALRKNDLCEPQCVENGCPAHSLCVEPEVCECKKGYFSVRSAKDNKHYCEPICEEACPENSECVGPNQCACKRGYHNIQQSCKPFCASGCPHKGVCVAPNKCSCSDGYLAEKGSCIPACTLGDRCQNGKCVSPNHCICQQHFSWNSNTYSCEEKNLDRNDYNAFNETSDFTDSVIETETDIETSDDEIDPNQVFQENIESTTSYTTDASNSESDSAKCSGDFIFHNGQCRPLKFLSNEVDCWLTPCPDENAFCLENGTCACKEGFKMLKTSPESRNNMNHTIKYICLSSVEYESKIHKAEEDLQVDSSIDPANWTSLAIIIFGVLILIAVLTFLILKFCTRQSGGVDVAGKNLACTYHKRPCMETEKSAI